MHSPVCGTASGSTPEVHRANEERRSSFAVAEAAQAQETAQPDAACEVATVPEANQPAADENGAEVNILAQPERQGARDIAIHHPGAGADGGCLYPWPLSPPLGICPRS
eukprot:3038744-Prymnesium_polylepis.3